MGVDYNSDLGYGVKVSDKALARDLEDEYFNEVRIIWSGSSYSGDLTGFLCISDSCTRAGFYDKVSDPINPDKMLVKPEWNDKLIELCKKHNIENPKIGWWLCSHIW